MIGVEIPGRYDGVTFYQDEDGNRYATDKERTPIHRDEVCKLGKIYRVKFLDKRGIKYKILSVRDMPGHTH